MSFIRVSAAVMFLKRSVARLACVERPSPEKSSSRALREVNDASPSILYLNTVVGADNDLGIYEDISIYATLIRH